MKTNQDQAAFDAARKARQAAAKAAFDKAAAVAAAKKPTKASKRMAAQTARWSR